MKRRIYHPLWIHLPAIGLLAFACVRAIQAWPLPNRVPLHFGFSGHPDRWGPPGESLAVVFGILVAFIALAVFLGEVWSRQETRKTFNWVALLNAAIVGALTVAMVHWLDLVKQQQPVWNTPWDTMGAVMTGAALVAAALERVRPFHAFPHTVSVEDTGALEALVASRVHDGKPWAYWEIQNPRYVSALSLVLLAGMTTASIHVLWNTSSWVLGILILLPAAAGLIAYGGLRVRVARGQLVVRLGVLGLRLLRIPLQEIASVQVQPFNPLREFGGWGPGRFGRPEWSSSDGRRRGVWAFFFRGTQGMKLVRKDGRTYLIGSDHPERLCSVVRAAVNLPSTSAR